MSRVDWHELRADLLTRCLGLCEFCGLPLNADWQAHHRRPRAMGGSRLADTNTIVNLLAVHPACHVRIESQRENSLRDGHLVRQGQDPATTPVLIRGGLVLLTPVGGYADWQPDGELP